MKSDPEPKDKCSREWYEWLGRKEAAEWPRRSLRRKQEEETDRLLSDPNRPKQLDLLIGGKITDVGFHPTAKEGGLTIDFERNGKPMRIVFGYTELGLWVYWAGERKKR